MSETPWEQMTVEEKLEQLRGQAKAVADLRYQIGHLEQRVQRLERAQPPPKR